MKLAIIFNDGSVNHEEVSDTFLVNFQAAIGNTELTEWSSIAFNEDCVIRWGMVAAMRKVDDFMSPPNNEIRQKDKK